MSACERAFSGLRRADTGSAAQRQLLLAAVTTGRTATSTLCGIWPGPAACAAARCTRFRRTSSGYPQSLVSGGAATATARTPGRAGRVHATFSGLRDSRRSARERSVVSAPAVQSRRAVDPAYAGAGRPTPALLTEPRRRTDNGPSGAGVIRRGVAVDNASGRGTAAIFVVPCSTTTVAWRLFRLLAGRSAAARWFIRVFAGWPPTAGQFIRRTASAGRFFRGATTTEQLIRISVGASAAWPPATRAFRLPSEHSTWHVARWTKSGWRERVHADARRDRSAQGPGRTTAASRGATGAAASGRRRPGRRIDQELSPTHSRAQRRADRRGGSDLVLRAEMSGR